MNFLDGHLFPANDTVEESLPANGFAPNRNGGTQEFLGKTQ